MIKFSSYEETNTPWIGEIPTSWSLKSLKHIFIEKKSTKNSELGCGSISFGKVIYKDDEKIPESTKESYQEVLDGEFLINPLNLNYDLKSLRIGLSRINVVVSQGYIVLKIKDGFVPEYYEYLLRKFDVEHMKSLGQGVRQTISYTHIKDEKLVVPPVEEQTRISRYLDKKTSQIDSLIIKIEKKIELLKEQRTSLINQYVTKGVNPNVEMKESGVKWIGDIPKHWDRVRLKNLVSTKITDGPHETPVFVDSGIPFLSVEGVVNNKIDFDRVRGYISSETHEIYSKKCKPQKDDVLLVKSGSTTGKSTIVDTDIEFNIWSPLCILRSDTQKITPLFLFNSVQSGYFKIQVETGWSYGTQPNIGMGVIENLWIPLPPINEQSEITKLLVGVVENFDTRVQKQQKKIQLLSEYRQSLISSVVTGKVRVTEDMV